MKRFLALLALFHFSILARGQDNSYSFLQFSEKDGLGTSQVLRLAEDRYRNLWLLTFAGSIYRFDGSDFERFTPEESIFTNNLYAMQVSATDMVWMLSDKGLIAFDGHSFSIADSLHGLALGYQSKISISSDHRVWLQDTSGHVNVYHKASVTKVGPSAVASVVQTEGATELWTKNGKLFSIRSQDTVARFVGGLKLSSQLRAVAINPVDGNTRTLVTNVTVQTLNFSDFKIVSNRPTPGNVKVRKALFDGHGSLQLLADYNIFVLDGDKWVDLSKSDNFPSVRVLDIMIDHSGDTWFGTDGQGVYRFQKPSIHLYRTPGQELVSQSARVSESELLVGTLGSGMYRFRDKTFRRDKRFEELDESKVISIKPIKNYYLIATFGDGLWKYDGHTVNRVLDPAQYPSSRYISCIYADGDTVYIGTHNGLIVLRGSSVHVFSAGANFTVNTIIKWRNRILVGFFNDGLYEFSGDRFAKIHIDGLQSTSVNCAVIDVRDRLWIASNKPYLFVVEDLNAPRRIELDNLSDVSFFEFTRQGRMILGAGGSAFILKFDGKDNIVSRRELTFLEGYSKGEASLGSVFRDSTCMWFGTTQGLYRYDFDQEERDVVNPQINIIDVNVPGMENIPPSWFSSSSGFYRVPRDLVLAYSHREISISFFGNDIAQRSAIRYRYRMEPIDNRWLFNNTGSKVTYSSLSPGDYNFIVEAQNVAGEWKSRTNYRFRVAKPFWQNQLFLGAVFVLACTLLFLVYRAFANIKIKRYLREQHIKEEAAARVREQVAMDFHDELGNKLAAIVAHTSALKVSHGQRDSDFTGVLDYVEDNAKQIYQGTRDFIWSIDVKSNNLKEVVFYIKDFGETLFSRDDKNFFLSENFTDMPTEFLLRDGMGRHMVLFCKEALTNIYKHAQCKNVWFAVDHRGGQVFVTIEDDGAGISKTATRGNGLKNMQKRAERIGGHFEILDRNPNGVRISLKFHL